MNPYQPPQSTEQAVKADEPVMSVRHGVGYSVYLLIQGMLCSVLGVAFHKLNPLASGFFASVAIVDFALAALVRRRIYFEVFTDRVELLSPVFPKLRWKKSLESVRSGRYHRWFAKREDFDRFVAWRDGIAAGR